MLAKPSVSVVLPVYISKPSNITDTLKCITLLRSKTQIPFELIVVETASKHFIGMADVYVYEATRTTPNRSVQRGFDCAKSDFVVFIGNDVFVEDNWLECLLEVFKIHADCGIATLGNNEHGDSKSDEIKESIYFSICMVRKQDAWFDNQYTYVFDDTDLIFRLYTQNKKCYKNLNCIVQHRPHSTLGNWGGNKEEFEKAKEYFKNKWAEYKDHTLYHRFVG